METLKELHGSEKGYRVRGMEMKTPVNVMQLCEANVWV